MARLILLLSVLACACSWRAVPPTPDPCRMPEPPGLPRVELHDCGEEWVGCLDLEGGLELERYLLESRRWMREAWERCR